VNGPLGFYRRQYTGDINEQKRDLELEQQRRQQQQVELRSNVNIFSQVVLLHWSFEFE
jgi:hypothetical protein